MLGEGGLPAPPRPLTLPAPSVQQGKMFFFIGLTMAVIQGTYARRIRPGGETAAVRRVGRRADWGWGSGGRYPGLPCGCACGS